MFNFADTYHSHKFQICLRIQSMDYRLINALQIVWLDSAAYC